MTDIAAPAATLDLQQLHARLIGRVRSPYEFVRRVDVNRDAAMYAGRLTRPLAGEDDLRLVCRLPSGVDVAVLAERLPWDSTFFGYNVAKLEALVPLVHGTAALEYGPAISALIDAAAVRNIRYLFASVDARDIHLLQVLGDAGFALIETRLFYHRSLEDWSSDERFDVRLASAADIPLLGATARDIVNPYDRFHADPFVRGDDADRLMYKWVEASILEGFADVVFVPNHPAPRALATVRDHRDKWESWGLRMGQVVFGAVSPEFKGWYRKLIAESHHHLLAIGAQHVYMSTQPTNMAVMRIWETLGYRYGKSEHILRKILPSRVAPRTP